MAVENIDDARLGVVDDLVRELPLSGPTVLASLGSRARGKAEADAAEGAYRSDRVE
jgi:hypothetical protein